MTYLWCEKCHQARPEALWSRVGDRMIHCPSCGRNGKLARPWAEVARINGYPDVPDPAVKYEPEPTLF